ncbi:MAG: NAD(P)/FAD-dependent oxidoreductase [Culicoidibacterales bacterium]
MNNIVDVVIIGAGPVGMYTAYYCGLRNMKTVLFDSLGQVGGQLSALYPEKLVYDLPGHPAIKAKDFIAGLNQQLERVSEFVDVSLNQNVQNIEKLADGSFTITTDHEQYTAKAVIITAGGGAFSPRLMAIENESKFTNIHYFVNDLSQFQDKKVVIFGGGDSAVDWSLMLEPIAKEVTIVHRRNEFRAKEANVDMMKKSSVTIHTPYAPQTVTGTDTLATAMEIKNLDTDQIVTLDVDTIIVNFGFSSTLGPIDNWGLEIERKKIIVDRLFSTNIPGIFACGDICTYTGRELQITTGLGEGLVASAEAQRFAFPNLRSRPIR